MDATDAVEMPKLPELDDGITLLTVDGRSRGALQSLVLDRLLSSEGNALWVDSRHNARTTTLATVAPSRRTLDRIRVARAFTAFQHYSLVEDLEATIDERTSLVVVPAIEWFYANDDLCQGEGATMLDAALGRLDRLATTHEIPVLVSRAARDGVRTTGDGVRATGGNVGDRVDAYCDARLECVRTPFGPRFTGETFETLVFECEGGVQTTFAFWRRVLERRHAARLSEASREVATVGTH